MIRLENRTAITNVEHEYRPLIEKAVEIYRTVFKDYILEIRLQGSVARGDEIKNVSDMDFLCILKGEIDRSIPLSIIEAEKELTKICPDLEKVDLGVTNEKHIDENLDYKLLIQTDSFCVSGEDRYSLKYVEIPGIELAKLWCLGLDNTLSSYRGKVMSLEDNQQIRRYVRFIGKDLLKACRPKLMRENEIFSRTITGTHEDLCEVYPDLKTLFDSLLSFYLHGVASKDEILETLSAIEGAKTILM